MVKLLIILIKVKGDGKDDGGSRLIRNVRVRVVWVLVEWGLWIFWKVGNV